MKLLYHKGQNFGDQLNKIIFDTLCPNVFDDDDSEIFIGIGSILGLFKIPDNCKKIYIFSTGYASGNEETYGKLPALDNRYNFLCVRGPLTAASLGLPKDKSVSDGALLLPMIYTHGEIKKKYFYSYMPHIGSVEMFPKLIRLCKNSGLNFIDPRDEPLKIVSEINLTEILISEAMHGAIIADAFRVPWIPIKSNKTINDNKWMDYLMSVDLVYTPNYLPTLLSKKILSPIFYKKLNKKKIGFLAPAIVHIYLIYQRIVVIPKFKIRLNKIKKCQTFLCSSEILLSRQAQLLKILNDFKQKRHH